MVVHALGMVLIAQYATVWVATLVSIALPSLAPTPATMVVHAQLPTLALVPLDGLELHAQSLCALPFVLLRSLAQLQTLAPALGSSVLVV